MTRLIALALALVIGFDWLKGPISDVSVNREIYETLWVELDSVAGPDSPPLMDDQSYRDAVGRLSNACRAVVAGQSRADRRIRTIELVLATMLAALVLLPAKWLSKRAT